MEERREQSGAEQAINTKTQEAQGKLSGNRVSITVQSGGDPDKALEKMLRRPRSRKYMKALKNVDLPSLEDEKIIERMRQEAAEANHSGRGATDGTGSDDAGSAGSIESNDATFADMSFTFEDIESFRKRVEASIAEDIEIENSVVEEVLAPCCITGCVVHSITHEGTILAHYTMSDVQGMDLARKKAAELVMQTKEFTSVEICKGRLVHRDENGDTIHIYRLK